MRKNSLFRKYVTAFVGLVLLVQAISSAIEVWITFQNTKNSILQSLDSKAIAVSQRIEQFFADLEREIDWTTRASPTSLDQRRYDASFILSTTSAIDEIAQYDKAGKEIVRLSRDGLKRIMDDRSIAQSLVQAKDESSWISPVYFGPQGPHIELAIAPPGPDAGMTIVDIDLKFLFDILNGIQANGAISAFITTAEGRVIAHTNSNFLVRNLDFSFLPQVRLARQTFGSQLIGSDPSGKSMLVAFTRIIRFNATIFLEQPLSAAYEPIYGLLIRLSSLFVFGMIVSITIGSWLARRMIVPIKALEQGALRFGNGQFDSGIVVHTGDELEALADEFNTMARHLQASYQRLEQKVESRTQDLAQSVLELRALEEIGRALLASIDINSLSKTILARAVELARVDASAIFDFDSQSKSFRVSQAHGFSPDMASRLRYCENGPADFSPKDNVFNQIIRHERLVQVPDIALAPDFPFREIMLDGGFRSALIMPLIGPQGIAGALLVVRKGPGRFSANAVALMQTFAHQSALALHNGTLFAQIEENGRQLAIASEHKTRFFANMSHELRTPLNAVLGYTELLRDGLYGEVPETAKAVLERVKANGHHLLGLIDDVLDLSKLEAGELALVYDDYSLRETIEQAIQASASLAQAKKLWLTLETPDILPIGRGDERRLRQVLLNIIGNAIKFTDHGGVSISAKVSGENFEITVKDTGTGIDPADQPRIFEAFQQGDNTSTRQKGGYWPRAFDQ